MLAFIVKPGRQLLSAIVLVTLSGCAARQEAPQVPPELPADFARSGQVATPEAWWRAFNEPALNQLVDRALGGNPGLRASYQRLLQARAVADRQSAALFPSLDATASAERRESDNVDTRSFSAGLSASYEVDLWGRVQSLSDAEALRASASLADYQAAAVSLAGELATAWFELIEQRAQYDLARDQLQTNRNVLTVIETRFAMGQSSSADVLRQRQLVSASRQRLTDIAGEIAIQEHRVAVLVGRFPGEVTLPADDSLPALPPLPDTGVPAQLVQRRPDLLRAWRLVEAADEELAAAISNRFPRLSLNASVTTQATSADNLFDDWLTTLAGNVLVPLVDGGALRAEVRRSRAVLMERVQQYRETTLMAFREVEDALARERQQKRRLQNLVARLRLADTTYQQLRTQYLNGALSYIEVLTALRERQELQRTILATRQQLLATRVGLYRALAGPIEAVEPNRSNEA